MKRTTIVDVLVAVLCSISIAALVIRSSQSRHTALAKQSEKVKVKTKHIDAGTEPTPVEITIMPDAAEVNSEIDADRVYGKRHYKLKNTSGKPITAIGVEITAVTVTPDGKQHSLAGGYRIRDTLQHPDIRHYHNMQPIAPGAEITVGPDRLKMAKGLGTIKEVTFTVDMVLFEDGTTAGPMRYQGVNILSRHVGAEKYKQWAKRFYKENGVDALKARLSDSELPTDLGLPDHKTNPEEYGYEGAGAKEYRIFLTMLLNLKKTETLIGYLEGK